MSFLGPTVPTVYRIFCIIVLYNSFDRDLIKWDLHQKLPVREFTHSVRIPTGYPGCCSAKAFGFVRLVTLTRLWPVASKTKGMQYLHVCTLGFVFAAPDSQGFAWFCHDMPIHPYPLQSLQSVRYIMIYSDIIDIIIQSEAINRCEVGQCWPGFEV